MRKETPRVPALYGRNLSDCVRMYCPVILCWPETARAGAVDNTRRTVSITTMLELALCFQPACDCRSGPGGELRWRSTCVGMDAVPPSCCFGRRACGSRDIGQHRIDPVT